MRNLNGLQRKQLQLLSGFSCSLLQRFLWESPACTNVRAAISQLSGLRGSGNACQKFSKAQRGFANFAEILGGGGARIRARESLWARGVDRIQRLQLGKRRCLRGIDLHGCNFSILSWSSCGKKYAKSFFSTCSCTYPILWASAKLQVWSLGKLILLQFGGLGHPQSFLLASVTGALALWNVWLKLILILVQYCISKSNSCQHTPCCLQSLAWTHQS